MIPVTDAGVGPRTAAGFVFHQDPVEELLKVFDAAFRIVVPGPGREIVGLKSISEKQNGAPGWYLWFADRPGAYLLELADAGIRAAAVEGPAQSRQAVQGLWRIKYFPDLEDAASLSLFSAAEQAFRESDCFDRTGTPDFALGGEIPDPFYQIGTVEAGLSADGRGFVLRLGAPERWVTRTVEGVTATDEGGETRCLRAAGEKDRDVPAWEWAWFLMERLVSTLCLAYACSPWRVTLHDAPACTYRIHKNGISRAVPDAALRQLRLTVSFRLHDGHASHTTHAPHAPHAAHAGSLSSLSADPSLLLEAPAGRCLASLFREPAEPQAWVSPDWWHLRERRIDSSGVLPC